MMKPILTIATYQGPAFRNQPDAAIEKILSICELSKALENKVWLVCSDVIENTEQTLGVGCSCIIDPLGNIVVSAQPLTENILMYHISSFTLQPQYMGLERANQEKYLNKYSAVI